MPSTANKILDQINTDQRDLLALDTFGTYKEGTKVAENQKCYLLVWIQKKFKRK